MNASGLKSDYQVVPGAGGLPRLDFAAPDGARAEVYLHGAHVAAWSPAGGTNRLFLSRASQFRTGAPIRGGIPVIFPQFGALGPLPMHGLARLLPWDFTGASEQGDRASAVFRLEDTEETRARWPYPFLAELTVTIGGKDLEVRLAIVNTGSGPFTFTAGLHTYFRVKYLAHAAVRGLQGGRYRDSAAGAETLDEAPQATFPGEVNRIYVDAADACLLVEPGQETGIRKTGFAEVVVWNPGAARCAAMPDFLPGDYLRFVCVEAAAIDRPIRLAPAETWQGSQSLSA